MSLTFEEKLTEIARLEREEGFLGISMQERDGVRRNRGEFAAVLTAEELADHALATVRRAAKLSRMRQMGLILFTEPDDNQA